MAGALALGQTARADDHWCDGERRGTRLSITSGTVSVGTHVEVSDLVIVNDDDSQTSGDLFLSIVASQNPDGRRGHYLLDVEDSHPNRDVLLRLRWISNREPIQLDPGGSTRIRFRSALREPPPGVYGLYARVYEWNSSRPDNGARCFAAAWDFEQQATFGEADDHGDTLSTATSVALPSETAGVIDSGDDADWFRFEVPATGEATAETTGGLDTVGALYGADGTRLAFNDDSAGSLNFRIQRQLDAGTYYVEVESFGNNTGSYALRLGFEASDDGATADDHGDTLSTATSVALPSETAGVIDPGNDADWFRFEVAASGEATAETTGGLDTVGALYGADGTRLAFNDDSGTGVNFRIQRQLDPGAYYVEVESFGNGTGSYALRLGFEASDDGATADDHGDSIREPTSVALPSETAGVINPGDDTDWFRFEAAASGEVAMETTGGLNTLGRLYDAGGNELAFDDNSGAGQNFRIQRRLDAGAYHLRVRSSGSATGSYTLRLSLEEDEQQARQWPHLRSLGDFNGDGKDDVLLRHADGRWHYYPMDGYRVLAGDGAANLTRDLAWRVAGVGDFDGDGKDDVLLRHDDGRWYFYPMDGRTVLAGRGTANLRSNLAWQVAGIGDFDGDGKDDVLLRHEEGRWHYYRMNGRRPLAGSGAATITAALAWSIAGVGDFNGDGRDDVLLRHEDGRWYFYPMNGRTSMAGRGTIPRMTADLAWQVTGIGDFDGDGRDDVLLRHEDGRWYFYPLNGRAVRPGSGEGRLISDTTRTVAGIGDMNGDGRADILIRRDDGGWHYYPMNGRNRIVGEGPVSLAADAAWTLAVPTPAETVDGLRIAADARSARPLQAVSLTLRGAAADADYDILLDLSGARGFADDDTIEVAPVKTAAGQLLFAAPLPETLAEGNAARRIAVRVRERAGDADATLSNTLMLALGETDVPDEFAGHPTVMMDVVLKAVYEGLDDPLLTVEAAAIEPGRSVRSARTLGLSTAYSDAQAQAMLQSLFGVSLEASGADGPSSGAAAAAAGRGRPAAVRCEFLAGATLCNAYRRAFDCVGDAMAGFGSASEREGDDLARCGRIIKEDVVEAWLARTEKIRSFGNILRGAARRLARVLGAGRRPAQAVHDLNAAVRQGVGMNKTFRTVIDRAEGLEMTVRERAEALGQTYGALRGATRSLTEPLPEHIAETEQEASAEGPEGDEREAYYAIVEEGDHHYSDRAALETETMEEVYTGKTDVVEALGTVSSGGAVGANCRANYEEFSVDDKTSTCVWSSLVEWNCYAGSRHVRQPNLGGANACLYYSLDYLQPGGTCRENYAKVTFQGRETCRWAELGADRAAWYTLEKEHGVENPQAHVDSLGRVGSDDTGTDETGGDSEEDEGIELPDGSSLSHPDRPDIPPAPDTSGLEVGCSGDRDDNGRREGRWLCVRSSGSSRFDTYRAGVLNGESGSYNVDGEPSGWWGRYEDGSQEGVWWRFYSTGGSAFYTYRAGVLNGESGSYNVDGEPSGWWGRYEDGSQEGVWWRFYSTGGSAFYTYRAGVLNGESGSYNADGEPSGCWTTYTNGQPGEGTFYHSDGTTSTC